MEYIKATEEDLEQIVLLVQETNGDDCSGKGV